MDGEEEAHCGIVRGVGVAYRESAGPQNSDEFAVRFRRSHHRAAHRAGDERPGGEPLVSTPSKLHGISGSTRAWNRVRCCPMRGCKVQSQL